MRESEKKEVDGMGTSAIAGIVCGGILGIVVISIVVTKIWKDRRKERVKQDSESGGNLHTKHNGNEYASLLIGGFHDLGA